jgi:excisionase family DNA binding protein
MVGRTVILLYPHKTHHYHCGINSKLYFMSQFNFNDLPLAVSQLHDKVNNIERLLLERSTDPHSESDQLLTIQQAGDLISLSVPTIYGLVSRSEIPVNKMGKRLYFSRQELIDWIKSGRKKTVYEINAEANQYLIDKRKG